MQFLSSLLLPAAIAAVGAHAESPVNHRKDWPVIRNFSFRTKIDAHSERLFFSIPISDRSGRIVYTLACHGGDDRYLDGPLEKELGVNFVGPMCFFLAEGSTSTVGGLLAEDGCSTWHTRGQIHYAELLGPCGAYPEYGKLRNFRLRGMVITIHFEDIEVDSNGRPAFLDLHVSGHCDSSITSSFTERPGYLPPQDCGQVKKGNLPRMFRGESGSWVEEKELTNRSGLPGPPPAPAK